MYLINAYKDVMINFNKINKKNEQAHIERLTYILNKIIVIFGEEKVTVPEGIDILTNLLNHLNRDVIRIINQRNDQKQPTNNPQ